MSVNRRYTRQGSCIRCGWCCLQEDPPCSYLKYDDEAGHYTCEVFNDPEVRHTRCDLYPDSPPIRYDGCGYYFYDTRESKTVKRTL